MNKEVSTLEAQELIDKDNHSDEYTRPEGLVSSHIKTYVADIYEGKE
jgi:hypothetical protein